MIEHLRKLRFLLTRRDKYILLGLFFMSVGLSLVETVGISAIMPFISIASNPELLTQKAYYKSVYEFFGFVSASEFTITFGLVLIAFYLFRGVYSVVFAYATNRFVYGRYHQIAYRLFTGYVSLPYREFVNRNSAVMTKTIVSETSNLSNLMLQMLLLFSELFTISLLYIVLVAVNWKITLSLTVFLAFKVVLLSKTITKRIKQAGTNRNEVLEKFYRIVDQTFGNFKIIKLLSNEQKIYDDFSHASYGYAKSNIVSSTLQQLPKNVLETIGFSLLVAVVVYVVFKYDNAMFVIPIILMYALAMYRMLPALNRIIGAYNNILFLSKSLEIVHEDLSYPLEHEKEELVEFKSSIELKNVGFSYDDVKNVLSGLNLTIKKGEKVAFVGESGGGKSTLVDLIIGVYKPQSGVVLVDGVALTNENIRSWRRKVGYIPQSIYLFDGTVAENVAFGHEYDEERIVEVLQKANIYDFLCTMDGINTKVGEGGIKLSGGQKQRIGIARALYADPEILVLDEATSALDNETEAKIMEEIYDVAADKTMFVIAHRLSTVERCGKIYRIEGGEIVADRIQ